MPESNTMTRPSPRPATGPAAGPAAGLVRPAAAPLPRRPRFTLTRDDVDDECPQEWVLRSHTTSNGTDVAEIILRWAEPMSHGEAQQLATQYLYGQQIRVAAWNPGRHRDEYHASVGTTFNAWQVTTYSGRGGSLWRRCADGSFTGRGGSRYSENNLARHQGPLTPVEVHNLPALVAELEIYRRTAGYYEAPLGCLDNACDEYYDDSGEHTGIDLCSHVETRIATAGEALALQRVMRHLAWLEQHHTPAEADVLAGKHTPAELSEMAGVRKAITEIREAIEQEDE